MAFAAINSPTAAAVPDVSASRQSIASIDDAFAGEPSLRKRVYDAISVTPQHASLFEEIAKYTSSLLHADNSQNGDDGAIAKKRKLRDGEAGANGAASIDLNVDVPLQFYMQDVSFAIPQRKKLTLEVTGVRGVLRARNQTSKQVEFGAPVDNIRHILCLPVPEKTQRQFNFCVIPKYGDGINPPPEGHSTPETIVWTVLDGPPKSKFIRAGQTVPAEDDKKSAKALISRILDESVTQTKVVKPDEKEFVSAMPEAHRKGEKAYHVKAFRGSKEGYLFFLSTGVFFGFKKPLLFFAFENIESISYTSVLQRTFNLNIVARPNVSAEDDTLEFEFSMIDQADYAGIDTYVKEHGLQDASMAEARRAKRYQANGVKTENGGDASSGDAATTESELQKAQRELEDASDEEEEDYDPGSDGDSDGSGMSSEEEDESADEHSEGESDVGEGRDLVTEELGSEAEVADEL